MSMQWIWKSRTTKPDWEARFAESAATCAALKARGDKLKEENTRLKAWVERVCVLVPQLKVRSDKEAPKLKAQLDALVAEARDWYTEEKGDV